MAKSEKKLGWGEFDGEPGKGQLILVVGPPKQGKSHFIQALIWNRFAVAGWQWGVCFCPTTFTGAYDFIPKSARKEEFTEEALQKYMAHMKALYQKRKKMGLPHEKRLPPTFLFFDDCIGILTGNSGFMKNFFMTCRHYNITCIVSVQVVGGSITPAFRDSLDHCVMFAAPGGRTIDALHYEFGGAFGRGAKAREAFVKHFETRTKEKFHAMHYKKHEKERDKNYYGVLAPAKLPPGELPFRKRMS